MTPLLAAARAAAARLGVYRALAEQPANALELAAALGASPRRLGALLDVLVATGALARAPGGRLAVVDPSAPEAPGAGLIAAVVARDRALDASDGWSLQLDGRALDVAPLLDEPGGAVRREIIAMVLKALAGGGTFLDAGGGLGDISAAVAAQAPRAAIVLADLPAVAAAARRRLGARATVLAGDLRELPLPSARVALLSNVLHMHGVLAAARVVAAVAAAVEPGGLLVVRDVRRDTLQGLLFNLGAAIHSPEGEVHDEALLCEWIATAGLSLQERRRPPGAQGAIILCARR